MEYINTLPIDKKKVVVLSVLSLVLTVGVLFLGRGYVSAGGQGNSTLEDGSSYPVDVINDLNEFCSSGQPSAQTTWVSLADNLSASSVTVPAGTDVQLRLNVVTRRCRDGVPTQLIADRFRAKGGVYFTPGGASQNNISQLSSVDDIIIQPPAPNGPAYSRGSWTFSVSTAGVTTSGDFIINADSKQFSWREVPAYFMCIMSAPQTQMWGNGNPPPGTTEQSAVEEMERVCPITRAVYRFGVNVTPPSWDVGVETTCDVQSGLVRFEVRKSGNIPNSITVNRSASLTNPSQPIPMSAPGDQFQLTNASFNGGSSLSWSESFNADIGQSVNSSISVSPGGGGTANDQDNNSNTCSNGPKVAKPYFKAYNSDVIVGRNFAGGASCAVSGAGIRADVRSLGNDQWAGAGSEFAARATGIIEGFVSRNEQTDGSPTALTFGNTTSSVTPTRIGDFAGEPGKDGSAYQGCIPNYARGGATNGLNVPGLERLVDEFTVTNGQWAGSGEGTLSSADQGYYWYSGDLTITGNITLPDWNNLDDIPKFYLVVEGNINIAPGVDTIDGVIIAQPNSTGQGGVINTCAAAGARWDSCKNKLTFNGAVVADKIELNRLNGDVAMAGPGDSNIAEVFNFLPELYLAEIPADLKIPTGGPRKYDSIIGLPPVL
jgi:hypothetical protein